MKVTTTAGEWHVRRRWAPRQLGAQTLWARFRDRNRRVRRRTTELGDLDPGCAPDIAESIVVTLVVILAVVFLVLVGIPFLIALGELLVLLLLALGGVVGRVLFRRPWTVDAVGPEGVHHTWSVVGWRASGAARQLVADWITATGTVPTTDELTAALFAP